MITERTDMARLSPEERLRLHLRHDELDEARRLAYEMIRRGAPWSCENDQGAETNIVYNAPYTSTRWIVVGGSRTPGLWDPRRGSLCACDCAQAVLPIYEAARPGDERPREAIRMTRRIVLGLAEWWESWQAFDIAHQAYINARPMPPLGDAIQDLTAVDAAASSVVNACRPWGEYSATSVMDGVFDAYCSVKYAVEEGISARPDQPGLIALLNGWPGPDPKAMKMDPDLFQKLLFLPPHLAFLTGVVEPLLLRWMLLPIEEATS